MSFVHLHTHSEYSLLDGANRITDLVRRAVDLEMPALALTDHGCLFGAWTFQKVAGKHGLKPILGMEAYVAPGHRGDRSRSGQGERAYYHLVLLARDREGYRNLVKLSSIGYTEGFYHKPRIDREVLEAHAGGLIVSSACLAGEVARHLMAGNDEGAREAASWYADVFKDRYYLEVQGHDSEGQDTLNEKIFSLATDLGLPVIATNDAHFLTRDDHEAHDVLLCIGLGKDRDDPNRMRYDQGLYFKSAAEMAERFGGRPDVLENTLRIADEVDVSFDKRYHLPAFPLPEGHADENAYLEHLTVKGAEARFGSPFPDAVQERLDYELGVIKGTGYAGYFLIVQDFIAWAREQGIPVGPGRGSAAGSLVAYALGITNLDPLEHDLLFERFLNPERVSMPDVDIDFCYERRGEVIEYTRQKYGKDAVGQIITFGTMKSRAVIRDVGRTLGFEPGETDRIAKLIPNAPGQSFTLEEAVKQLKEVRDLYEQDERHKRLFDYAMTLEGLSRHASVHAAGVVIAPGPLDEYVPVCVQTGKNGEGDEGMTVTQYDMNCLEEAGMLKMDFLGLKTLTVIHDAVEMVRARVGALKHPETGEVYESMDEVPLDDPVVYRMLSRGGTSGVFQFESSLALDKLRAMRCDRFDDLVATNALIRPGPLDSGMTDVYIRRKTGQEEVAFAHPELEKTLEPTYGIIVYQEQVMRIANVLAGFSLGEADVLRKAVGKKDARLIAKELGRFVERAVARGVDERVAKDLAEQIETFGRYGFNKCLPGHAEVLDAATGLMVRIDDVFEGREALRTVVACDTESLKLVEASVVEVFDNGVRPVYRLTTESGREIEATDNHPLLTGGGWKALGDLAPGEHVAVPRSIPVEGTERWTEHEVVALGRLLAEGDLSQGGDRLADPARPRVPHGPCRSAAEKEIPAEAFALDNGSVALLLALIWADDGLDSGHPRTTFHATASKRLAHQVRHLLLRLGVVASVRSVDARYRGGMERGYEVHVEGDESLRAFAATVGVRFPSEARRTRMAELVLDDRPPAPGVEAGAGWSDSSAPTSAGDRTSPEPHGTSFARSACAGTMTGALAEPSDDIWQPLSARSDRHPLVEPCRRAEGDVLWDRVASIEHLGEMRTYDLEVAGHHNFLANDVVVHNSHSAAYSLLSYHTAWLKAHYPAEFMAGLLSSVLDKTDDVVKYIAECRDLPRSLPALEEGVEVLPPDVNESGWKFTAIDGSKIRFGLGAVRGVGAGAVKSVLAARAEGGRFTSLFDFLERIDVRALNKRACEALTAAGALDAFGHRAQLLAGLDTAYQEVLTRRAEEEAGQASLFGEAAGPGLAREAPPLPQVPDWPEAERLAREKEALGFFISGHPLDRFRDVVQAFDRVNTRSLQEQAGQKVELACVVTSVARQISRRDNSEWGKIVVEDFHGTATVLAFKEVWQASRETLATDAVVLVRGQVSGRERDEEDPPIFLDEVVPLDTIPGSGLLSLQIELPLGADLPDDAFARARAILSAHPGGAAVELTLGSDNGLRAPRLRSRSLTVDPEEDTLAALRSLFGKSRVRLVRRGSEQG